MSHDFEIPASLPFDWPSLMAFLQLRATPGVEAVRDGVYVRTFGTVAHPGTLSVSFDPGSSCLRVEHPGSSLNEDDEEIARRLRQLFRTTIDTTSIERFLGKDRWLREYVKRHPGLRVPGGWNAFEIAVRAVMGQQVSVAAATTLMGRLMRMSATWLSDSACIFPSPEQILQADIRDLGMPRKRIETLRGLARFFVESKSGSPLTMEGLLAIPGIGRWTAGYILMRAHPEGQNEHDHWPEGDLVLRKALSPQKELISHVHMAQIFERWKPWRSYATLHIWKGYDGTNSRPE
ncbi:MAG TPA: AlkA N-terminal domain-containing protein [Candidatus Saccharimonadales bacterium]|jgi:3-methyladenine DNA glycosylase/8-oxoguanine DNA glycosylase|nr:AlkA N-terminal domain-containing protein [Candidatus Saccharimonadales bacterium]